jgi:4'-phosphopantetheinyl transferase EntD
MIAAILPLAARYAEALGEFPTASLFPEEASLVERAVEKRWREFAAGRALARQALKSLGVPALPIPCGEGREPRWPDGIVGSITHCAGYCAAAVAPAQAIRTVGIDAEPHAPLPDGVLRLVARIEEVAWIEARAGDPLCWDRILFSAKESIYKAWFPVYRRWLDFDDVSVIFDPPTARFRARLVNRWAACAGASIDCFEGRFLLSGTHVLTSTTVAAT